jgi:hypothetical protein
LTDVFSTQQEKAYNFGFAVREQQIDGANHTCTKKKQRLAAAAKNNIVREGVKSPAGFIFNHSPVV